jgi:hypothetical protein
MLGLSRRQEERMWTFTISVIVRSVIGIVDGRAEIKRILTMIQMFGWFSLRPM